MDLYTLKRHTEELKEFLINKPVIIRTAAGNGRALNIYIHSNSGVFVLILNLDLPYQGMRLAKASSDIEKSRSIIRTFNRLITNGRILSVSMPCSDRIVKIHIGVVDPYLGKKSDYYIICEFTGRVADIFLCGKDHKILDRLSRTSNNSIGDEYQLPEQISSVPSIIEKEAKNRGITVDELISEKFSKAYIYLKDGKLKAISRFELTYLAKQADFICNSVNEAANLAEEKLALPSRLTLLKERALVSIKSDLKQKQKLLKEQLELKVKYENAEELQNIGNLLVSNLYRIKAGSKSIELQNWNTGNYITVELDPAKTPAANAQRFFIRYKKAKRGIFEVNKRIEELNSSIKWLEEQIWLAENASEENDLIIESLYTEKKLKNKPKQNKLDEKNKIKAVKPDFETETACYYVGRSAKQNDFLTFHVAKNNDYWFHANDVPGAHVIMKLKSALVSDEDLYQGALLAAKQSFAKNSSKVSVDYTKIMYVKRIPNGGMGQVNYTNQKTLIVSLNKA